jgi:hypothetical protein
MKRNVIEDARARYPVLYLVSPEEQRVKAEIARQIRSEWASQVSDWNRAWPECGQFRGGGAWETWEAEPQRKLAALTAVVFGLRQSLNAEPLRDHRGRRGRRGPAPPARQGRRAAFL